MANQDKTQEIKDAPEKEPLGIINIEAIRKLELYSDEPRFIITNVVRRVETRLRRAAAPGRLRFKQYVCGKRLLRKQSISVTRAEMEEYKDQLEKLVRAGAIKILTPEGVTIGVDHIGNMTQRKGQEVRAEAPKDGAPKKVETPEPPKDEEVEADAPAEDVPPANVPIEPDDLTEISNVGGGRAKKLVANGIDTFAKLSEMNPGKLAGLLNVTEDMANEIIESAFEKVG